MMGLSPFSSSNWGLGSVKCRWGFRLENKSAGFSSQLFLLYGTSIYFGNIRLCLPQHDSSVHFLRLERVNLKSKAGIAKVFGTAVCLAGAMLLSFYKGIALTNTSHESAASKEHAGHSATGKWMLGTVALFAGSFSWASWFLLRTKVGEKYPALDSSTAVVFSFSFLQVAVLSLTTQRGLSIWVPKGKMEILTVLFAGIMGSGVGFLVMSWCVEKRGPVFAAAFSPLTQIMVAAIGVSILHEQLYLGSVLGSILVIAGLYFLLWGKSKDARSNSAVNPS